MDSGERLKCIFSSAYAGSVRYYASMLGKQVGIDAEECIEPHSWMHNHCRILGANGVQTLAVPIVKPAAGSRMLMRDMKISEHGDWRRIHWGAIFSAYGKTPFFEYIAPDLETIYNRGDKWLLDFNESLNALIVDFLDLPIKAMLIRSSSQEIIPECDYRKRVGNKKTDSITSIENKEYYHVWKERHGFIPDLSIIDLLMNMGRESIYTLNDMITMRNL